MKKSIERKVLEEKLSPYGFRYAKYQYCRWTFSRTVKDITQNVVIQKGIWGGGSYQLEMDSSINSPVLRLSDLSEDARYVFDELAYSNEEEQKAVLEEICDVVIKYGIERLNKSKARMPRYLEIVYKENEEKLYRENMSLTEKFMERNGLTSLNKSEVFSTLRKELGEICGKPHEQIQDKLVEMAAVYGNMLIEITGGMWKYNGKLAVIEKEPILITYSPLRFLTWSWEVGKVEVLIREYIRVIDSLKNWVIGCLDEHVEAVLTSNGWTQENIERLIEEPLEELDAKQELDKQLYRNHEALAKEGMAFMEVQDVDGIEAIQKIIYKMQELEDEPLESIIHELLMACAVYGEIYRRVSHGEWEWDERGFCTISNNASCQFKLLEWIISGWINNDYNQLVRFYKFTKKTRMLNNIK